MRCEFSANNYFAPERLLPRTRVKRRGLVQIVNFALNLTDCFKKPMSRNYGSNCCGMIVTFVARR